jgi:endonuclease YncB( thermonuclease family)
LEELVICGLTFNGEKFIKKFEVKKLLLAILMTVFLPVLAQKQMPSAVYDFPITRVIDGDTVAFRAPFLPPPLKQELSIRVYGVDTPEKGFRAKCPSEDRRGQMATAFTKQQIASAQRKQIVLMDWDKYGGRVLGDIILDGRSLRQMLIQNGFAREYYGETKQSWC